MIKDGETNQHIASSNEAVAGEKAVLVARFRGIIPWFVEWYAQNLGARFVDGKMVGNGWRAEVKYHKVQVGSLELTEAEMLFEGDEDAIRNFLSRFRAKVERNAG